MTVAVLFLLVGCLIIFALYQEREIQDLRDFCDRVVGHLNMSDISSERRKRRTFWRRKTVTGRVQIKN